MLVLVNIGEIFLKGKNRNYFENKLISQIKEKTQPELFIKARNRYIIKTNHPEQLKYIFGVDSYAYTLESTVDTLKEDCLKQITNEKSFKITTQRSEKFYKPSPEINREIGEYIYHKIPINVDLHHPEINIHIDLIKKSFFISTKRIRGLCGLPIGSTGKVHLEFEDEKLGTVSAFLLLRRGCKLTCNKELPLIKKFTEMKSIDHEPLTIATDETLETLKEKTDNLVLKPLIGYNQKEIKELYEFIKNL